MKAAHLFRPLFALPVAFLALAPLPMSMASHPAQAAAIYNHPTHYYLALGDSLAYGYQQYKVDAALLASGGTNVDPAAFTTGYVNDYAALLRDIRPREVTVNYGCPSETTGSFIAGGCPWPFPLHDAHSGSQLSAAVAFLHAHPLVSPITVDLGANDILNLVNSCGGAVNLNLTCIAAGAPAVLNQVGQNLTLILGTLRQAAPHSQIIVMQLYNPLAVEDASTDTLTQALNGVIGAVAAGTHVTVADAYTPFNVTPPQPQTLCVLTLFCTALHDIHPSDAGYAVIARQFWAVSGYGDVGNNQAGQDGDN